ncbi:MAG: YkgJ family cysteine cluster protein [Myxococcota bacterium]
MTPRVDADGALLGISPARPMQNPCRICPGKCCFPLVHVSLPEAIRITTALDLPFLEAIALVPDQSPDRSFAIQADARITAYLTPFSGRVALSLRRQESGGCMFLADFGGFRRCSIYGLRPSPCRIYPLRFERDDAVGGPDVVLCPVPYAVGPGAEEMLDAVLSQALEDWAIHRRIIAEFEVSGAAPTVDAFLDFALPRAAEALGIASERVLLRGTAATLYGQAIVDSRRR